MNNNNIMQQINTMKAFLAFSAVLFAVLFVLPMVQAQLSIAEATVIALACDCDPEDPDPENPPATPKPVCDLKTSLTRVNAGDSYTITWKGTPTSGTTFKINGANVNASGNATYNFKASNLTERYLFTGQNSGGTCVAEVVISKIQTTPTCNITANVTSVAVGGSFTISWVGTPATAAFKINGSTVVARDSATYTFPSANETATFTFTGNNGGLTCSDQVVITKKTTPTPAPICDSFAASPISIERGQSATLTWATTNATVVSINQGVGSVTLDGTRSVSPTQTTNYTLTARNAAGTEVTCARTVTVTNVPVVPAPICTLNAAPVSITRGQSSELSYTSQNAVSASLNQGIGSGSLNGTRTVSPTVTTTYILTVTNSAGVTVTCSRTITVTVPNVPAPICTLNASPTTITRGQSAELTYTSQNGRTASLNQGIGNVSLSGSRTVSPTQTTSYTFTVTNSAGVTVDCTRTITVNQPVDAPICDSFTASPATINRGSSATLTWTTTNATVVSINMSSVGSVPADGSSVVSPTRTTTYVLTARNSAGDTATCAVTVIVENEPEPEVFTCPNNVTSFTADDTSIDEGQSTTLRWNTTGVTSVSIDNNVRSTDLDGSESVSPRSNTTYNLTASNGTRTISCPLTIRVDQNDNNGGGGGSSPSPRCELKISDKSITKGDRVTLEWETSNATEVTLKDNHGKTLVTTEDKTSRDKKDLYDGDITLRPDEDTTYTLIAERGSKDKECKVKVDVKNGVTVITDVDQDLLGGIVITQLPYTGFEAGPFLTMVFYGLLLLWALYLAYVLVIRRTSLAAATVHTASPVFGGETIAHSTIPATMNATPQFVAEVVTAAAVAAPVIGYAATIDRDVAYDADAAQVESAAHAAHVLFSSDAMRQFVNMTNAANRSEVLANVIAAAKASYPSEDGWVVLTGERMTALTATTVAPRASFTPASVIAGAGNSSLAEAIATGNIIAAYQLIENRPMVALADAAAELDNLYRAKSGAAVTVSTLLADSTVNTSATQVKAAIDALTSALDGTYTSESEAVKMSIMKAVKAMNG